MPRYRLALTLWFTCFSMAANALEVTNLDAVDHHVAFDSAGTHRLFEVRVNETLSIPAEPSGFLSLVEKTKKKPSGKGQVHADGMLSGVLSAGRRQGIPVDSRDALVIWPGGDITMQQHNRGSNVGHRH